MILPTVVAMVCYLPSSVRDFKNMLRSMLAKCKRKAQSVVKIKKKVKKSAKEKTKVSI